MAAPEKQAHDPAKYQGTIEQVEDAPPALAKLAAPPPPDRRWFARFLKQPPSPEFNAAVVALNDEQLDEAEVKRIRRRLDWLICPALAVCYAFYYIDKTTLSYAAIFGIKKDLHLTGGEYSWLSSLFYFGWVAWALPTNILMQKFPLAKYLAINIFFWGLLLMCQAASRNFAELAVLRILGGAFEATADPAFVLITSTWFTRAEQPVRIGVWYSANGFGIALGGLLGYGIGQIHDGVAPWQWEFIIIGALCIVWSVVMYLVIPDAPHTARGFSPRERALIVARKRVDQQGADARAWRWDQALEAAIDPKFYLFFLFGFTANVPNGGTSNFGTLIVKGFGFNTLQTTLMQIPYGVIIALIIFACVYLNKIAPPNTRTLLMALVTLPTVAGFAMMAWCPPSAKIARLIGYWMTGSSNAVFVLGLSLVSGNVSGQTKKALCSASVFLGVALGNIVGPFLFKDSQAPGYKTGIIGCMISRAAEIVVILLLRVTFLTCNRRRDRAAAAGRETIVEATITEDITDWQNPAFRYVA